MVLPELPLLTLSFAISALSLSAGLRSTGLLAAAAVRMGPAARCRKPMLPPACGRPREKEACAGTLEKWRDKCCEHHWPNDLLTAARWTSPGRRTPQIPQIMGFSWDLHWVFMGFSWGFHGVFMGCLLEA